MLTHYLNPTSLEAGPALCGNPDRGPLDLNFCHGEITCPDCREIWAVTVAADMPVREYVRLVTGLDHP